MLYKLGKVISKTKTSLIFESNYTGYVIQVNDVNRFESDKFQKVFIYNHKNDYSQTLYGFKEFRERIFFEDLLSITGVGPKTAMSILSSNWKEVMDMIASGQYDEIAKIPYVGLRTARQIVFDFQKKYKTMLSNKTESKNRIEVFNTLRTLGFNEQQISLVSSKLKETNNVDEMIEKAIEIISHEHQNTSIIKA